MVFDQKQMKRPGSDSEYDMKRQLTRLTEQYATALRKHLKQGAQGSFQPARALGREAVNLGLETLDIARIHSGALATLEGASRDGIIKRAEIFFKETITPIEKTHRAAVKTKAHLGQVHKALNRRTTDLAVTNRSLKQSIVRRKTAEDALKMSGRKAKELLDESDRLQKCLQRLSHQIMITQETNRKKISKDLQNEIAQTLVGIKVRLLTLRRGAAVSAEDLKKEIANTQRLVDKSMRSIKGFALEYGKYRER
jgi:signal transduction histidine kinase